MATFVREWKEGVVRTAVGTADPTGGFTVVALVKFGAGPENQWLWARQDVSHENAANWTSVGIERGKLRFYRGIFSSTTTTAVPRGVWLLVCAVRPAGSAKAKFYYKRFDTSAIVELEEEAATEPLRTGAPSEIQLGRFNSGEKLAGNLAAIAVFNTAFSKSEWEALVATASIKGWGTLGGGALALWMLKQSVVTEEVPDTTGHGANQTAREGTAVLEETPPIPYEAEEEPGVIKPNSATATASIGEDVVANHVVEAGERPTANASMPNVELVAGAMPSPTEQSRAGLPLPFPSVLANPARLGPPRFSSADRKTLGIKR